MRLGNRHPAEIINKYFVLKLWICDLFWKRATGYCIFVLQVLCQITTMHTSTAQFCCNFCVVDNTPAADFTVSIPFLYSANPGRLIASYRNIKQSKTGVKVSWNALKLKGFKFFLFSWKGAFGTVHFLVSWKLSVCFFLSKMGIMVHNSLGKCCEINTWNAMWNLGIFIGSITSVVHAFALKLQLLCKDINQKLLLQKHKCVNKHHKKISHPLS